MSEAIFYRVLDVPPEEKGEALAEFVASGKARVEVFQPQVQQFSKIPNTTFAYWSPHQVLVCFENCPLLEGTETLVRAGLGTTDNFRFLRLTWEIPASTRDELWISYAKGG